ncbi:uncharacterized protein L969DRAFT_96387 [Mixia osmundae IAM 14324]|uniref:TRP C-terminal domain-containing protein n=1 Tax=Mixia osmundae (strain CBS 9802 / IAM 14324 / JCM 22182 / KY 12970) TaxID=764103 RepID=G7DX57_MIXOS|nr:uncharacterized protein L969DRAFT_96387 [Mixia osmundae IAM 14324]KEI37304.1 hypothetical protein L969DRAFT_96387 [Mixia osmundae IAM 14324]GAA95167.1 hypothetical protein E5Q_01822 [Mixia osmundae IAM 14324]
MLSRLASAAILIATVRAVEVDDSLGVPPMQWINLSKQLNATGLSPPALYGACLSAPTLAASTSTKSGSLLLFGGRSSSSATSGTYLLDLTTLSWSKPSPPNGLSAAPSSRSHSTCTYDSASNYRNGVALFGGLASDGTTALNDLWLFDSLYEFWTRVDTPDGAQPTWSAVGGIDPTYTSSTNTSNAFVLAGGISKASDALQTISLQGQVSSNVQSATASLSVLQPSSAGLLQRYGAAGTILPGSTLVQYSGCNATATSAKTYLDRAPDLACALSTISVATMGSSFDPSDLGKAAPSISSSQSCPAARLGAAMVPNLNSANAAFSSQALLIGGAVDTDQYDALHAGEVAVYSASSATWMRVIPAPDSDGSFPSFGLDISAVSLQSSIGSIKGSRAVDSGAVDVIIYGGRDSTSGQASNAMWLLRLYGGSVATPGNANNMTFLDSCAVQKAPNGSPAGSTDTTAGLSASMLHSVLGLSSILCLLAGFVVLRAAIPSVEGLEGQLSAAAAACTSSAIDYSGIALLCIGWATGVSSLMAGLLRTKSTDSHETASLMNVLDQSRHAQAALVYCALSYLALPCALFVRLARYRSAVYARPPTPAQKLRHEISSVQLAMLDRDVAREGYDESPATRQSRTRSFISYISSVTSKRLSGASDRCRDSSSFRVVNRRVRASQGTLALPGQHSPEPSSTSLKIQGRSMSELSMGPIQSGLWQAPPRQSPALRLLSLVNPDNPSDFSRLAIAIRCLTHAVIGFGVALLLGAAWSWRQSLFALLCCIVAGFYIAVILLALRGRPGQAASLFVTLLYRWRSHGKLDERVKPDPACQQQNLIAAWVQGHGGLHNAQWDSNDDDDQLEREMNTRDVAVVALVTEKCTSDSFIAHVFIYPGPCIATLARSFTTNF